MNYTIVVVNPVIRAAVSVLIWQYKCFMAKKSADKPIFLDNILFNCRDIFLLSAAVQSRSFQ